MKLAQINIKTLKPWLFLLIATDLFFTFLLWIIAEKLFSALLLVILLFSLLSVILGCYIDQRQQHKKIKLLEDFLKNPSNETEGALLAISDRSWHSLIHHTGLQISEQNQSLNDKSLELHHYQEFIEEWTHEIKTPLTVAMMVLDNHKDEVSPYVYKRLEYARHSISALVERVLYYARLSAPHVDYQFENINLKDFVEDKLQDFTSSYIEHNVDIQVSLLPIHVASDKRVLSFILSQILSNAFKYCSTKEGIIRVENSIDQGTSQIRLSFSNNGKGVPSQDMPFIFDKGFTGSHHNRQQATGMGLYFARKYSQKMSITIDAEETPGLEESDTYFTINLKFPKVVVQGRLK